jgi:hypothetical protein
MVESCKEGSDAFVIQCDGGVTLLIDLREQNWPGPEAMTYSSSTGDLFVWRAEDSEKAALAKQ